MSFESTIQQQSLDFSSNHALEILNKMNVERKSTQAFCDVTIKTDDGDFSAHKCVLSAFSEFYSKMFSSEMKEKLENEVSIKGVSSDIMDLIMEFIYTCKITLTTDNAFDVLAASEQLQIPHIKDYCQKFLISNVNEDNCLQIYSFARMYHLEGVTEKAEHCIFNNLSTVVEQLQFKSLDGKDLLALMQVKEREVSEEALFCAVISWINYDKTNRASSYCEFFKNFLFIKFCRKFLNEIVKPESLVMNCKECLKTLSSGLMQTVPQHRDCVDLSCFIVVGGKKENVKSLLKYNVVKKQWVDMPESCCQLTSAHVAGTSVCVNKTLYLIGGEVESNGQTVNSVKRLTLLKDAPSWQNEQPMLEKRKYFASAVLNDFIYVSGCSVNNGMASCEQFDRNSNKWCRIGNLNQGRGFHGMVALNEKLYVAGGSGRGMQLASAECFDPATNVWEFVASMHEKKISLCLVALNDRIFAIGGYSGSNFLSSMEVYNPSTGSWGYGAPLNIQRSEACACVIKGKIYIIGGRNYSGLLLSVEVYDPALGMWEIFCNLKNSGRVCSSVVAV
ncbi:kelch-like protein 12 [Clavelina lepadiformis]|uniref:kelch-like protein 12 n=1 Tax=Clavelina lepadiformis TaxID=159417 RepID=UPI0040413B99